MRGREGEKETEREGEDRQKERAKERDDIRYARAGSSVTVSREAEPDRPPCRARPLVCVPRSYF